MDTVAASRLRKGDRVVCPRDGCTEKVLFSRRSAGGKRQVRTSRHDHFAATTTRFTRA